jgi:hypothetical protein
MENAKATVKRTCSCGGKFTVTEDEIRWATERDLPIPLHCHACRQARCARELADPGRA